VADQITDWLSRNAPVSRVLTAGELTGALQVWADVPQVGGGADQGASNPLVLAAHREVTQGCSSNSEVAERWLRALACPYIVVHAASSREHYHFCAQPERFANLPIAWTNNEGDTIYRLPPPEIQDAVVVDLASMAALPPLRSTDDVQFLSAYVNCAQGKRPA